MGVNNQTLAKVDTIETMPITAPVRLSNMDLNLSTDHIFDDSGQPLSLSIGITEKIDAGEMEEMFNSIVLTRANGLGLKNKTIQKNPINSQ